MCIDIYKYKLQTDGVNYLFYYNIIEMCNYKKWIKSLIILNIIIFNDIYNTQNK